MGMGIQDCIDYLIERGFEVRGPSNDDILLMVEELQAGDDYNGADIDLNDFD